jgi:hypothetical protein
MLGVGSEADAVPVRSAPALENKPFLDLSAVLWLQ